MIFKPAELKLEPLDDVPIGALAEIVGPDDPAQVFVRLADRKGTSTPILLRLNGVRPFSARPWGNVNQLTLARVLCPPESLRIVLGARQQRASACEPGVLTIREGGAFIRCDSEGTAHDDAHVFLPEWRETAGDLRDGAAVYPAWELGMLDHRGEFVSLFKR